MIALVDYGAGNLTSVRKGLAAAGAEVFVPTHPADLGRADGIVIPGVGHFRSTEALGGRWVSEIRAAIRDGMPLFGICLGLQWLFEGSEEAPGVTGLGLIGGRCFRLPVGQKVPHVGWNSLSLTRPSRLFAGVPYRTQVYFTHSYAAPVSEECVAVTTHGVPFAAGLETNVAFAVQFHPEKSSTAGIQVLRNFVALTRGR